MQHKELYRDVAIKKYSDFEKANCLFPIVKIMGDKIEWIDNEDKVYLWALFGKNKSNTDFECLQVGASIDGRGEIETDIKKMFDTDCLVPESGKAINTQFYLDAYFVPEKDNIDKSKYQYRKIKEDYDTLIFYKIDINEYLHVDDTQIENQHLREVFNLSKAYYAETKFAFDTQSIYWNAYRSGVGMETLKQLIAKL